MSVGQRTMCVFALYVAAGCLDDVSGKKNFAILIPALMRLLLCRWLSSIITISNAAE